MKTSEIIACFLIFLMLLLMLVAIVMEFCFEVRFYKYRYCENICFGKKCRNWQCKLYNECSLMHVQQHSKRILNAAGYELVIGDGKTAPLPDYIPEDGFPVDFARTESRLHFNTEEEMLAWAGTIYKHYIEFINNDER